MKLDGRRIQIAGSASPSTPMELLRYAHTLVEGLIGELSSRQATFIAQGGQEPHLASDEPASPAIIFDWTILETVAVALQNGVARATGPGGKLLACVSTHKMASQLPGMRQGLWDSLIAADAVRLEYIEGDWTSGAVRRERQAELGEVLIALSGGEGVEHLAQLYAGHGKPVVPLDLDLGSSSMNGSGGASRLNREALVKPGEFFRLADPSSGAARLRAAETRAGQVDPATVVAAIIRLLDDLCDPQVFYVRPLSPEAWGFADVEAYFRNVVDPVVGSLGYAKAEMGEVSAEHAFLNVEIFDRIHHAAAVVVDLTGLRPNCMMELGYAFGRLKRVILTAMEGTHLPFDPNAIDTRFWSPGTPDATRIKELTEYCARTATRPPLVGAGVSS